MNVNPLFDHESSSSSAYKQNSDSPHHIPLLIKMIPNRQMSQLEDDHHNNYKPSNHSCNVKKQIQRLSKDEGVVVTTYEGMHSHPIEKSTDNFEHILSQMQIYTSF
ncbi:WRKY DNA binding protein [Striga asiatica]|uniref:WRKY DNA binding protein n=1 Tax=Striga asiatica TaxID=4170 RepID=A0A5A7RG05_STRAF|nr:WRKY DNA binding protein [Striga asiatica]